MKKLIIATVLLSSSTFAEMRQSRTKNPADQSICLTKGHFANMQAIDQLLERKPAQTNKKSKSSKDL